MSFPFRPTERIPIQNIQASWKGVALLILEINKKYVLQCDQTAGLSSSYFLESLALIKQTTEFQIHINGQDMNSETFHHMAPIRANIGFGFQKPIMLSNRTLMENLLLPTVFHWSKSPDVAEKQILEIADQLDFRQWLNLRPYLIPSSALKLASLARVFLREPELIILDQPFCLLQQEQVKKAELFLQNQMQKKSQIWICTGESSFFKEWEKMNLSDCVGQMDKHRKKAI